ncbi:MAG: MBL fold metallo-hydrolase [Deltaproteobacteria bacterium]|nr:MBL fold metallo-hydrolase [Deltaproteobacteria bacterium]
MLKKMAVGPYQANCYILACKESGEGLVIDPGGEVFRIVREIAANQIRVRYILLTHGHFDHTGGAHELKKITKAPVLIHPMDAGGLAMQPDGALHDGQRIQVGKYTLSVLHTPGHSPGGVCFFSPGVVFTGDTLFAGSVGRTDFPGGDHNLLVTGILQKILPLGDDVRVYPGHGPGSTIGVERKTNPFLRMTR